MIKKILSLFMVATVAVLLVACGPKGSDVVEGAVNFDSRGGSTVAPGDLSDGKLVSLPETPTKSGYVFNGWYETTTGGSWRDPEAVDLENYEFDEETVTFYAFWKPIDAAAVTYSAAETYKTAITSDATTTSPINWENNLEGAIIDYTKTEFFYKDIDWDKAIAEGIAAYDGDFSQFQSKTNTAATLQTSAFDWKYTLGLAASFPVDANGESYVDANGNLDKELASSVSSTKWTYTIRDDVKFQTGVGINADTIEYTLQKFVDPTLLPKRANGVYHANYLNLKGAKAYFDGEVSWDSVGYTKESEYSYTLEFTTAMTLKQAVDMMDMITLLPSEQFEAGYNEAGTGNTYGTPENLLVSYGQYVIKEWSLNQKWVLNKNFDFINQSTTSYKSITYEVVAQEDQRETLFSQGALNAFGLSANYYAKYVNDPSRLAAPDAYSYQISFNGGTRGDGKTNPTIIQDHDFRMAVYYAIDREDYAKIAAAPDVPNLAYLSDIHISAVENLVPYNTTKYHSDVLNDSELALSPETYGYLPTKAKELFDKAYAKWIAEGNSGKVVIEHVQNVDSTYATLTGNYLKSALEELFGTDKFEFQLTRLSAQALTAARNNFNYGTTLNTWGGATSLSLFFMYAIYGNLSDYTYGMEPGFDIENKVVSIDYSDYKALLEAKDAGDLLEYETLFLEGGTVTEGESTYVVKPVGADGIWTGTISEFSIFAGYTIEDSSNFELKHEIQYRSIAAIEKVLFSEMVAVPLTTSASSTVYTDVVIEWPNYSLYWSWGNQKYRYLTTDPDYAYLVD